MRDCHSLTRPIYNRCSRLLRASSFNQVSSPNLYLLSSPTTTMDHLDQQPWHVRAPDGMTAHSPLGGSVASDDGTLSDHCFLQTLDLRTTVDSFDQAIFAEEVQTLGSSVFDGSEENSIVCYFDGSVWQTLQHEDINLRFANPKPRTEYTPGVRLM